MITIVSGLPRSGTSLMMQMLEAGGLAIASDDVRSPDPDNPRGYYELEAVKRIRKDAGFLDEAEGRVVKIVAPLLPALPDRFDYRILFMERDLDEVLASQRTMLERSGRAGAGGDDEAMRRALERELARLQSWLAGRTNVRTLFIAHAELLADPQAVVTKLAAFLVETGEGVEADRVGAMAAVVDTKLHRHQATGGS